MFLSFPRVDVPIEANESANVIILCIAGSIAQAAYFANSSYLGVFDDDAR